MRIAELLKIRPGVTALIGGGGKTTLMYRLGKELSAQGRVIVCTSTRIRRPDALAVLEQPDEETVSRRLEDCRLLCLGTPAREGKLGPPTLPFARLAALADYVIVEADGSRGLPLKAHAPYEPVIPQNADQTVLVLGAEGFGKPIETVCHRPELYAARCGAVLPAAVTPAMAAAVLLAEGLGDRVYLNQCETEADWSNARALAPLLPMPVTAGSLWREEYRCLY